MKSVMPHTKGVYLACSLAVLLIALTGCWGRNGDIKLGLITKQEANPYWVTMREVAEKTAKDHRVTLLTATGKSDVDVDSQRAALEQMIAEGVSGILIAPTNSSALLPEIRAARESGVTVIAVDTPVEPLEAVDAYFATDNVEAGRLVGHYARAKASELGLEPKVALLELAPGIRSGDDRSAGFLEGFGITESDPAIVAVTDTEGNQEQGKARMAEILAEVPDVNVVYAVNEPAALGALEALKAAKADLSRVLLVTIDGGCEAIKSAVRPGDVDATAMQFPENMAREGIKSLVAALGDGKPEGFFDTGVKLITDNPAPGVDAEDVAYGVRNCWGD